MTALDLTLDGRQAAQLCALRREWWVRVDLAHDFVLLVLDRRSDGLQRTYAGLGLAPLVERAHRGLAPLHH